MSEKLVDRRLGLAAHCLDVREASIVVAVCPEIEWASHRNREEPAIHRSETATVVLLFDHGSIRADLR